MDKFCTNDLLLAAFLKLNKCELLAVQPDPKRPDHGTFIFAPHSNIGELSALFYSDGGQVEPRAYMSLIRDLKSEAEDVLK